MKHPRRSTVVAILVVGLLEGIASIALYPTKPYPPSAVVAGLAMSMLTFLWYRLDTDLRSYRRTPLLSVAMVGLTIFALPYYFYRSRGFARGSLATLGFIGVAIASVLAAMIGAILVLAVRT